MAAHVGLKARKVELALREEGPGGAAQIRINMYIYTPYYHIVVFIFFSIILV